MLKNSAPKFEISPLIREAFTKPKKASAKPHSGL